jgi:hypothetical protein
MVNSAEAAPLEQGNAILTSCPGWGPGIHEPSTSKRSVDGRGKPGHDDQALAELNCPELCETR